MSILIFFYAIIWKISPLAFENNGVNSKVSMFQTTFENTMISLELYCLGDCFGLNEKLITELITGEEEHNDQLNIHQSKDFEICKKYEKLASVSESIADGWIGINFDKISELLITKCFKDDESFFVIELDHRKTKSLAKIIKNVFFQESQRNLTLSLFLYSSSSTVSLNNCLELEDDFKCLKCRTGYYLDISNECSSCSKECLECERKDLCSQCMPGYYSDKGLCVPCSKTCSTCSDFTACDHFYGTHDNFDRSLLECSCKSGCSKDFNTPCKFCKDFCAVCDSLALSQKGFYSKLSLYVCDVSNRCYSNCEKCDLVCILCRKGFELENGNCRCSSKCEVCYPGCSLCDDNVCVRCSNGYYLASWGCLSCFLDNCSQCSANECFKCNEGYYFDNFTTPQCLQCQYRCKICSDSNTCKECMENYYLISGDCRPCGFDCAYCVDFDQCTECNAGFYLEKGVCYSCDKNCLKCLNRTYCLECESGSYYLSPSSCINCKDIIFNCITCLNATHCLECKESYFLELGRCIRCGLSCKRCLNRNECIESYYPGDYKYLGDCYYYDLGCVRSSDSQKCIKCNEGFFYLEGGCYFCSLIGCQDCLDLYNCANCYPGFYLFLGNCIECSSNCEKCATEDSCLKCQDGYVLEKGECLGSYDYHCIKYLNKTSCVECLDGYYPKLWKCIPCIYPCLKCSDNNKCLVCDDPYILIESRCDYCNYKCSECINKTHCSECSGSHMYLSSGRCKECEDNCIECVEENKCTKCKSRYFLRSGYCYHCTDDCKLCLDENNCLECYNKEFVLVNGKCSYRNCDIFLNNNDCDRCLYNYFSLSESCIECISYCSRCSDYNKCISCPSGYYLDLDKCYFCGRYCYRCLNKSECIECNDDYILYLGICYESIEGCLDYLNVQYCQACKINYCLYYGRCYLCKNKGCYDYSGDKCIRCYDGYFLQSEECFKCDKWCLDCTSKEYCNECYSFDDDDDYYYYHDRDFRKKSFYSEKGKCYPCADNCLECHNKATCTQCSTSFYLDSGSCYSCPKNCYECYTGFHCFKCNISYFLFDMECLRCPENCFECSSSTNCYKCKSNEYYLKSGICYLCPLGCFLCQDETTCTICYSGFYLESGKCIKCSSGCLMCKNKDICSECDYNYSNINKSLLYLKEGKCLICKPGIGWIRNEDIISLIVNEEIATICFNTFLNFSKEEKFESLSSSLELKNNQSESNKNCFNFSLNQNFHYTEIIELNISELQLDKKECNDSTSSQPVKIIVNYTSQKPKPEVQMKVNFSSIPNLKKNCESTKEYIFDGSSSFSKYQKHLNYNWTVVINSKISENFNQTIIKKNLTDIQELAVYLNVSTDFNTYDFTNKTWNFKLNKDLNIEMSDVIKCKKSIDCEILIDRLINCSELKNIKYNWNINKAGINENKSSLLIKKGTLEPGSYESILSIENDSGKISTKNFTLIIIPESLKILFNRSPGIVSNNEDLLIDASESVEKSLRILDLRGLQVSNNRSMSINNSVPLFIWECFFFSNKNRPQIYNLCPNQEKSRTSKLLISKEDLNGLEGISIRLNLSTDDQFQVDYFNASISSESIPKVNIFEFSSKEQPKKFPVMKTTVLVAEVDPFNEKDIVEWHLNKEIFSNGYLVEIRPDERGLIEGDTYKLLFSLQNNSRKLEFDYEFQVNKKPESGTFYVDPSEGEEFKDIFTFVAKEWVDDDIPLRYSFAYGDKSSEILLRMSLSGRYPTVLAMFSVETLAFCRVYDALDDFSSLNQSITIHETADLESIVAEMLRIIEPPSNIPVVIGNILIATLIRKNNSMQSNLTFYQEIFENSIFYTNIFIATSSVSDFFINQSLNLLNYSTFNKEITQNNSKNINLSLNLTETLLGKVQEIGIDGAQAASLFDIVQNIQEINDEIIKVETNKFKQVIDLNSLINLQTMKRMNYNSNLTISAKTVKSFISVINNHRGKEIISGLKYSVRIPSDIELNIDSDELIGFVHSHIERNQQNSMHDLVSLSLYNKANNSSKIPVYSTKSRIIIQIPYEKNSKDGKNGDCYYFDEDEKEWSTKGCKRIKSDTILETYDDAVFCSCNHLTTFGYGVFETSFDINHGVEEFTSLTIRLPGFILPIALLFAFILTLLRAKNCQQNQTMDPKPITCENKFSNENDEMEAFGNSDQEKNFEETNKGKLTNYNSKSYSYINPSKAKRLKNYSDDFSEQNFEKESYFNKNSDPDILLNQDEANRSESILSQDEANQSERISSQGERLNEIVEDNEQDSISLNNLSQLDKPESAQKNEEKAIKLNLIQKISKLCILYSYHCHIVSIVILNKFVNRKYYKITKIFLILFLEILFDALFFNYNYKKQKVEKFEQILGENFQSFNLITVLFTAAMIAVVKFVLFLIEVLPVKRTIRYRFVVLPFIFVLIYGYCLYKVSCISTAFREKISRVWVFCCLVSIVTEIVIFEPILSILVDYFKKLLNRSENLQRCYRKTLFWRLCRCKKCKKCENCKANINCESCAECSECMLVD